MLIDDPHTPQENTRKRSPVWTAVVVVAVLAAAGLVLAGAFDMKMHGFDGTVESAPVATD